MCKRNWFSKSFDSEPGDDLPTLLDPVPTAMTCSLSLASFVISTGETARFAVPE
jgi:hypothetical protein